MAMFSNPDIDVETLRFSQQAGTIKLPVQVRPLQDEAHEIANSLPCKPHSWNDIVNQLRKKFQNLSQGGFATT